MYARALLIAAIALAFGATAGCNDHTDNNSECAPNAICSASQPDAGDASTRDAESDSQSDTEPDADADADTSTTQYECPEAHARVGLRHAEQREWHVASMQTEPLEALDLDASQSTGDIARYEWTVVDRPSGSIQIFHDSDDVETPRFFLDIVGTYRFKLQAFDPDGRPNCNEDPIIEVTAVPEDDLYIELVWDTPADDDQTDSFGTDLALHYLNPNGRWNNPPWDIFWRNSVADWGVNGDDGDDPRLVIDDTNGAGPSVIRHDGLEDVTYRVGVHYFSDNDLGPSYATVRIYSDGELAFELGGGHLESTGWFWEVAEVDGPDVSVRAVDEIHWRFPDDQ